MGLLDTIVKTVKVEAVKQFGESAVESISHYTSEVVKAHIEKNNLSYVYTLLDSEAFCGMDYREAEKELSAYGFKKISLLEKKDLKDNWLNRNKHGKVIEVCINGKSEFRKKAKFLSDAQVVIRYHGFKG